jgi:hypothetical protein
MAPDDLERRLVELGAVVDFPPTPPLVEAVVGRLAAPVRPRRWLRVAVAAAAAVVIVVGVLPGPRRAIADLLGIGSVRITVVSELPPAPTLAPFAGDEVSPEMARVAADFVLRLPDAGYGDPDRVFFDPSVPGGLVTLVYESGDGRPALVITETVDSVEEPLLEKTIDARVTVQPVEVGADPGFWIEGSPHLLLVRDADGNVREDATRLVGDTLLFTRAGVTIRIESALSLEEALDVAASL